MYQLQMNRKKERIEDLKNDVVFKYVMTSPINDHYLLKSIIEAYLGIFPQTIYIDNPQIYPDNLDEKEFILDIKSTNEVGRIYDIEMQTYPLTKNQYSRFESYLDELVSGQTKWSEPYDKTLKKTYVIVLYKGAIINNLTTDFAYKDDISNMKYPYGIFIWNIHLERGIWLLSIWPIYEI